MTQKYSLKDDLFNAGTVARLGDHFEQAGVFTSAPFVADVMAQMPPLELKARINMIADVLARHLPPDFQAAGDAILTALPPPLDPALTDNDFGHFIYAPLGVYVENRGLADHLDRSLDLLQAITQRFSMEFSIRAFLNRYQDATLERMRDWVSHDHYHVRRLVSEGTRPRLPWGQNVGLTAADTLPLLDKLQGDPTRFVTRSVANHLNDITKIDPEAAIDRLTLWQKADRQEVKELDWMRRHALRGLIKAGYAGAMQHLGYRPDIAVDVSQLCIAPQILARGDVAAISFALTPKEDGPMIVDYVIDFVKANGKTAPKVFKMKILQGKADTSVTLRKTHHFKDNATTFKLHPGTHQLHIQVNGRLVASQVFDLT